MWKALLAGTTALMLAGSSVSFAQQPAQPQQPQRPQVGSEGRPHWRPSEQDVNALTDARIAAIKAGLKLTLDQEKNWPGVEQAIRDLAKDRYERRMERQGEPRPADPIERLRERADAMTKTAADLKRLADAAGPLYQSLNEDQKHRLFFLVRSMRGHHVAHWREHRGFERD